MQNGKQFLRVAVLHFSFCFLHLTKHKKTGLITRGAKVIENCLGVGLILKVKG